MAKAPTLEELKHWALSFAGDWNGVPITRLIHWGREMAIKAGEWPCECSDAGRDHEPEGRRPCWATEDGGGPCRCQSYRPVEL